MASQTAHTIGMSVVRPPAITEDDLGPAGWRALHEMADMHGWRPSKQILPLVRWALYQYLIGQDVELTRSQFQALVARKPNAEVA